MDNKEAIEQLQATKNDLLRKAAQIDEAINTMKAMAGLNISNKTSSSGTTTNEIPLTGKYSDYPANEPIRNKLAYVLKKENKFLHIRQIAAILHEIESKTSVSDFITKLYPAIAELKKTNTIVKHSIGTSNVNTFWGSKNWLDSKKEIKKEHMFDEDQIKSHGSHAIEI